MTEIAKTIHQLDVTPYVEVDDTSTGFKHSVKKVFKSMFTQREFQNQRVLPAFQAYLMSRYGNINSNDKRMDEFMGSVASSMQSKYNKNEYFLTIEIPDDIIEFKNIIIQCFKDKGYIVEDLSEKISGLSHSYLFICWDNFKLAQESLENVHNISEVNETPSED